MFVFFFSKFLYPSLLIYFIRRRYHKLVWTLIMRTHFEYRNLHSKKVASVTNCTSQCRELWHRFDYNKWRRLSMNTTDVLQWCRASEELTCGPQWCIQVVGVTGVWRSLSPVCSARVDVTMCRVLAGMRQMSLHCWCCSLCAIWINFSNLMHTEFVFKLWRLTDVLSVICVLARDWRARTRLACSRVIDVLTRDWRAHVVDCDRPLLAKSLINWT